MSAEIQAAAPSRLPGARASLLLLLTINLFNYIDRYILAAVEPRIRKEFFANDSEHANFWMGTLATAFLVSYMLAAPLFGWLGDRMNRWTIVGVGVLVWSLASGASGLAATFAILLTTRVFVGIGEAAYGPIAPTVISDLYPVERRGSVLAWFYMAMPVGAALGFALGGLIASFTDSWRWPFYAVVVPGLLLCAFAFLRKDPPRGNADPTATRRHPSKADYLHLFKIPSYVFNLLGMTAMTFAIGGMSFWMRTYISEFRGLHDEAGVNTTFGAILVISGLAATLLGGIVSDKLRARWPGSYFTVSAAGMLLGFPLFLAVLWVPFPYAWVFLFLAIFCLFLNTGPTNTIIANVTHPSIRASAYAVSILFIHLLGDAISPFLIGLITDHTKSTSHPDGNMNTAFLAVSAAILLSGVFWMLGARHLGRDTARASGADPSSPTVEA